MKKIASLLMLLCLLCNLLSFSAMSSEAQKAFSRRADVPDVTLPDGKATSLAGMALIGTNAYSVKLKGNAKPSGDTTNYHLNEPAVIFRSDIITGETVRLTAADPENDGDYVRYLHHANGVCGLKINGKTYLFVATLVSGKQAVVKVLIEGNTYSLAGEYEVMENGVSKSRSGIDILAADAEKTTLLLKTGGTFYKAEVPHTQTDGQIESTELFKVNMSALTTESESIDASSYTWQDCGYAGGFLYVPVSNGSESVVGVFHIYNSDGSIKTGTLDPVPGASFRIGGGGYSNVEIESCAVYADGTLIFNANAKTDSGSSIDGIFSTQNTAEARPTVWDTTPKKPETPAETPAPPAPAAPEPAPMLPFNILTLAAIAAAGAAVIGTVLYLILRKKKH